MKDAEFSAYHSISFLHLHTKCLNLRWSKKNNSTDKFNVNVPPGYADLIPLHQSSNLLDCCSLRRSLLLFLSFTTGEVGGGEGGSIPTLLSQYINAISVQLKHTTDILVYHILTLFMTGVAGICDSDPSS